MSCMAVVLIRCEIDNVKRCRLTINVSLPRPSSPAKAGDPVFQRRRCLTEGRGVLDSPLPRGMTAECGAKAAYSAGLAPDEASLLEAC